MLKPALVKSKGKAKVVAGPANNKKLVLLVKPKGVIIGAHTVPVPVVPELKEEGFDFAENSYDPLSIGMLETILRGGDDGLCFEGANDDIRRVGHLGK